MTLSTVTYDDTTHKIVPITCTDEWVANLVKTHGEPAEEISEEEIRVLINELLDAAPSYKKQE